MCLRVGCGRKMLRTSRDAGRGVPSIYVQMSTDLPICRGLNPRRTTRLCSSSSGLCPSLDPTSHLGIESAGSSALCSTLTLSSSSGDLRNEWRRSFLPVPLLEEVWVRSGLPPALGLELR